VVAVVSVDGDLIAWSGDIDRPFFLGSSAKPFQALVSQQEGALLRPVELALACASHEGQPAHVAIVESMLDSVGLNSSHLRCPHDWPLAEEASRRVARRGHTNPRRVWHNCSGKHAAFLRACRAQGWSLDGYLETEHPLQRRIADLVSDLGEFSVRPVGVDGCGAPVLRTTARSMALLYARLASAPELEPMFSAMHRYPSLVSGSGNGDASIGTVLNAAAKRGAAGCLGVAVKGRLGIGVKAWDGLGEVADVAAISTLDALGVLPLHAAHGLESLGRPQVLGGDRPVGVMEPTVKLRWS
jgi:L-asparaginase II